MLPCEKQSQNKNNLILEAKFAFSFPFLFDQSRKVDYFAKNGRRQGDHL